MQMAPPTFLILSAGRGCLPNDSRHVFQSPGGTTARPQRFPVEGGGNPPHLVAALAQLTDFREHVLLTRIWFDVLAVRAETESEPDIAHPLPSAALVPQGVTVRSQIASRSHCGTAAMMVITRRPVAEAVSSESATETKPTLEQFQ
jgi:hypothetical protein